MGCVFFRISGDHLPFRKVLSETSNERWSWFVGERAGHGYAGLVYAVSKHNQHRAHLWRRKRGQLADGTNDSF
jgi:hypothetical protein